MSFIDNQDHINPQVDPFNQEIDPLQVIDEQVAAFGKFEAAIGPGFKSTQDYLRDELAKNTRSFTSPPLVQPWECRIGGARFFVPPLNISVSQSFRSGSNGAAIRQQSPVRFNSGHSETTITMTLYFPTHETIWGFDGKSIDIDFDTADDAVIDRYISSLRGLITQFKYTPILPIKNVYLNSTYNINAVVLQSMSISTIPNFPFSLAVSLTMLSFNHKVFIPMVERLEDAIHWGRFRQYIGRAAKKMQEIASKDFLSPTLNTPDKVTTQPPPTDEQSLLLNPLPIQDYTNTTSFNKIVDFAEGKNIELYYPDHDPARIIAPDIGFFKDPKNTSGADQWQQLANFIGIPATGTGSYANVIQYSGAVSLSNEYSLLLHFLQSTTTTYDQMGPAKLQQYLDSLSAKLPPGSSQEAKDEVKQKGTQAWYAAIHNSFLQDPYMAQILAFQQIVRGQIQIQEWDVPMRKLGLDNPNVIVTGVSASIGNAIVPHQLSLQDQPTYQHIGGLGVTAEITITVFGEEDLGRLRAMYDTINGLARLEHGHAILGFLGIKNVVTALCGMKYCVPMEFDVETIPNYPHVYNVRLIFLDFDVFQQKREILSSDQQSELIEAFSKKNPFFRIKQLWGAFNAYPDFPLDVRDTTGKVLGHLDPDYYFRAFKTMDDDIVNWRAKKSRSALENQQLDNLAPRTSRDYEVIHHLSTMSPDNTSVAIGLHADGFDLMENGKAVAQNCQFVEPHPGNTLTTPYVDGCTPAAGYMQPYFDGGDNPDNQADVMLADYQYRDKSGRMIRAFPTYMLWLIDEGGRAFGMKLFDNFYGLQSVLDFSIVRSEDILGDTMVMKISNLYSRLSTKYKDLIDPQLFPNAAAIINPQLNRERNLLSGLTNYLVRLDTIQLQPGVRVHLRVGYSANPNLLETVFNGVITQVEQGDVITITCQSDAIELSPVINNKHKSGSTATADFDGSLTGLWMSEPRDLMTRLLCMGGSVFRETIAYATHGMIFSENRFGIRHFGTILYEPMTELEKTLTDAKSRKLSEKAAQWSGFFTSGGASGNISGMLTAGVGDIMSSMWINLTRKRDYELYKRNIYPGNGTGVAQYMGGDLGDGGVANSFMPVGVTATGLPGADPNTGLTPIPDPISILGAARQDIKKQGDGSVSESLQNDVKKLGISLSNPLSPEILVTHWHSGKNHPILSMLGITSKIGDDDLKGFDEVSFRAQTYMKSVWDIFMLCAALLPNYVVAVRPFEDRSTVFYGKPHWMYTAGLIPLTKGVKEGDGPALVEPDQDTNDLIRKVENQQNKKETPDQFYDRISQYTPEQSSGSPKAGTTGGDPTSTTVGVSWGGGDISQLPLTHPTTGAVIPVNHGDLSVEMHLPTSEDLQTDIAQHQQLAELPDNMKHPFYMDREGGTAGGYTGENQYSPTGTVLAGDSADAPGQHGAFGYLDPIEEQWYMNMRWQTGAGYPDKYRHKRVMVYCERTQKAVICCPGEYGPADWTGRVAGVSPDAWFELGQPNVNNDPCWYGWVDDSTPLGPVDFTTSAQFQGSGLPSSSSATQVINTASTAGAGTQGPPPTSDQPSWMKAHPEQSTTTPDAAVFSMRWGWEDKDVPVNYSDAKFTDNVGTGASQVYSGNRSEDEANEIWNEFRDHFGSDDTTKNTFKVHYPDKLDRYDEIVKDFQQFMWQNAYHRGWIVLTADSSFSTASVVLGDTKSIAGAIPGVGGTLSGVTQGIIDVFGGHNPFGSGDKHHWDFDRAHKLFEVFITKGQSAAIDWMKSNDSGGRDNTGLLGQGISLLKRDIWNKLGSFFSSIKKAVGVAYNGILSLMRISLFTLGGGLNMSAYAGRQANVLNKVFNDSVYYQAGPFGSLLYYADNPFTREYGEPVVEIREPFQRMHMIDSFNHIINDGIIENFDSVYTVVTATSGGSHPVTVHFDKSAPAEKQVEKAVDTGLFWDEPKGPLGGLVHPVEALRSWKSHFNNGDQETSAKRVALWHLKESLKDIYTGELIILGDPSIRPHDLVSIADSYEKIYGMFEVEQVVHHFNPDIGFITSITPNAVVNINDPGRWQVGTIFQKQFATHSLRTELKHQLGITANNQRAYGLPSTINTNEILDRAQTALNGSVQYHGGISALVKDVGGMAGIGGVTAGLSGATGGVGLLPLGFLGWKAFGWVRDNLLDAHGCYIQYLNKNGKPMDASLSANHSVAVGQVHGYRLLADSLNITIPFPIDGSLVISSNDILSNLGWNEHQIEDLTSKDLDLWENSIRQNLLKLTNRDPEVPPLMTPAVYYVTVVGVENGDTLRISPPISGHDTVRLRYIHAPHTGTGADESTQYAYDKLVVEPLALGYDATVALRLDPTNQLDPLDNSLLAIVFSNVPGTTTPDQRQDVLTQTAKSFPAIAWDSYMPDGRPYSFNWQTVINGHADIASEQLTFTIPGQGVIGGGG